MERCDEKGLARRPKKEKETQIPYDTQYLSLLVWRSLPPIFVEAVVLILRHSAFLLDHLG